MECRKKRRKEFKRNIVLLVFERSENKKKTRKYRQIKKRKEYEKRKLYQSCTRKFKVTTCVTKTS